MKNVKYIATVLALAALTGAFIITKNNKVRTSENSGKGVQTEPSAVNDVSLGMYAEKNAVIPSDQKPGSSVLVKRVLLENPGYIVIHEENAGEAGDIIGSSSLYQKGEFSDVSVDLTRQSKNGETLYAMLHQESDSNQSFDPESDKPVPSESGAPIMASFIIDQDAQEATDMIP